MDNSDFALENASQLADASSDSPVSNPQGQIAPPLNPEEEQQMMQSIVEIFQLDEDPVTENEGWEEETAEDQEAKHWKSERLRMAFPILQKLWWSRSELMPAVTEKLADGSRCIKWRGPIGDAGILEFFLEILDMQEVQHSLMVHILRLVGNSCADTDENRQRVVSRNSIPSVMRQLQNSLLLPFAIPVLFNVCVDYEPAQKQASEAHLSKDLIDLISSPRFDESQAFIGYVCKLFDLLISQTCEQSIAPESTPIQLLTMATNQMFQPDLEDFVALTNSAIAYLKHERFQESLIKHPSGLSTVLAVLTDSYNRFGISDGYDMSQMRFQLTSVLSDISALPSFSATYPLTTPFANYLLQLVSTATTMDFQSAQSSPQLITAACIILGNLARTDTVCQTLVNTYAIHFPLSVILSNASRSVDGSTPISSQQTQLSYAVLGLLRNLAIPASNKPHLGHTGLLEPAMLPRLWSLDTSPQIQYTSIHLTRQIITGCLPNIKRLCQPLSADPDSPASGKSSLHILLGLHKRSDEEATKMEISRIVTAVCRVLHTTQSSQSPEDPPGTESEPITSLRQKFYDMHSEEMCGPLSYLITQGQTKIFPSTPIPSTSAPPKHPVLRSEGWFVLALMAGTPEGSKVVAQCMHDPDIFGLTCEILSGRRWEDGSAFSTGQVIEYGTAVENSTEQEGNSTSMTITAEPPQAIPISGGNVAGAKWKAAERSNVFLLVSELLKHHGEQMASFRREVFEDLVRVGAKDVERVTEVLNRES